MQKGYPQCSEMEKGLLEYGMAGSVSNQVPAAVPISMQARLPDMQSVIAGLGGGISAASRALHSSKVAATGVATSRPDWCS